MLSDGALVRHPQFGPGRVVAATFKHVWVYFPDLPGAAQECVKQLDLERCPLAVAPEIRDPRLAHLPVKLVNGVLEFPKSTRISHADAVAHFLSDYPKGFRDKRLFDRELGYKREAQGLFKQLFGNGKGRRLLAAEKFTQIAEAIDRLFHSTNIPAVQEIMAVHDAVKHREAAAGFLSSTLDFVDMPSATTFHRLVEAVDRLPAEVGKARVLTWPTVTLLPFLADPTRFIVMKPVMTRTAAERLFFDLAYDSRPNWPTYERGLAFAEALQELLKPHGARDFIDVQSFIWVTAGQPAMKATRATKATKAKHPPAEIR